MCQLSRALTENRAFRVYRPRRRQPQVGTVCRGQGRREPHRLVVCLRSQGNILAVSGEVLRIDHSVFLVHSRHSSAHVAYI